MGNYWLVKEEPKHYSFAKLKKEKKTTWEGVHNNLALKHINNMEKGDLVFFYHTGNEKQIVGIMEVISNPYPNPKEKNKRFLAIDVKYKKELKNPVTLAEIKKQKKFKNWELLRIPRLSVMPVPKEIWNAIMKMSRN